jgi:hypothetical protein
MTALLAWVDHDAAARQRMHQVLALFRERETRDELGIGAIRDSIADQLFPGTNTIQTRLRYMLFVPWVYQTLESRRVSSSAVAGRAREFELQLADVLKADGDKDGVFGWLAGQGLKRLPSSVYWSPLGSWGIRRFDGSQDEYHRALDAMYRRRRALEQMEERDGEVLVTWDPELPPVPPDFPSNQSCALSAAEATYLRDRIVFSHPTSFLAAVVRAKKKQALKIPFPWLYPDATQLSQEHQELLHNARLFSEVIYGAAICYNLSLARIATRDELVQKLEDALSVWMQETDWSAMAQWDLHRFWGLVLGKGHQIGFTTQSFVEGWIRLAQANTGSPDHLLETAEPLIRVRESRLKGARSRFTNQRARDQWGGSAGLYRLDYRWGTAAKLLDDLYKGLGAH